MRRPHPHTDNSSHQLALRQNPAPDLYVSQPLGPHQAAEQASANPCPVVWGMDSTNKYKRSERNKHRRIPCPVVSDLDCQYLLCVHTSTITWSLTNPLRIFYLCLIHSPPPVMLLQASRVYCEADRHRFAAATHNCKHAAIPFDLQCLKPSVYGCVARGRIPVIERLNQHSLQAPVRQSRYRFYYR